MKKILAMTSALILSLASSQARTWTSSDGRTLEGDLVRVEGEIAIIKVKGKSLRIPFSKLSEKDVAFLKEQAEKAKVGTNRLFGLELKSGTFLDFQDSLKEPMQKLLAAKDFAPTKIKVRMSIPQGFDPLKPQKVLWMVGSFDNSAEIKLGNIGVFDRGESALEKGWVIIAADTNMGNPRRSEKKTSEGDAEFHYFLINELEKAWPEVRRWKHACAGHSTGAEATFFRVAQLLKADVNVVGGFFSGCQKGMTRMASSECRLSSRQWSKVKAFQSTGDNDGLVKPSDIKRVSEELKRGGVKQIVAKTFPGNHTMSDDLFKEALDWFEKEEAQ